MNQSLVKTMRSIALVHKRTELNYLVWTWSKSKLEYDWHLEWVRVDVQFTSYKKEELYNMVLVQNKKKIHAMGNFK